MNAYEQQAVEAFRAWHAVAASEFPSNMPLSFDAFLGVVKLKGPNFLNDFGKSVAGAASLSGVGMSGVIKSMQELARQYQGRYTTYPDGYPRLNEFSEALVGRALNWDFSVVSAVSKDIAIDGANKVATIASVAFAGWGLVTVLGAVTALIVAYTAMKKGGAAAKSVEL